MLKSMTGVGRAKYEVNQREYVVEIKAVNHKYSDITIKLPKILSYLEDKIKKEIATKVHRGKVDVFIDFTEESAEGKEICINRPLAKSYIQELKKLQEENELTSPITIADIMKLPDVLVVKQTEEAENVIWEELKVVLHQALDNFVDMRMVEGERLKDDITTRILDIEQKVEKICAFSTGLVEEYVVKLNNRIKEILQTDVVEQTRLAQEVVIYADKSSIEEETTRLKSHVAQCKTLLEEEGPVGKKLDFLIQEMNRETNTIGSKSVSIEITNLVIDIKTQLENIREQIQNIE